MSLPAERMGLLVAQVAASGLCLRRLGGAKDSRRLRMRFPVQRPRNHPLFDRRGAGPPMVPEADRANERNMGGAPLQ